VKLGLISDIHGDPVALELAWAHLTLLGADRIVAAGDLVGYGPFPDRVVAFVTERQIATARGNHDRWAVERGPGVRDEFGGGTPSAETLDYLANLPFDVLVSDEARIAAVVHGSPWSDMEFVSPHTHPPRVLDGYLATLKVDLLVIGHTHQPMWHRGERGLVVNPGSLVSMPVRTTSSRTFALVDLEALTVSFHDVETGGIVEVAPWAEACGAEPF
jgi:putative phosphoesterase